MEHVSSPENRTNYLLDIYPNIKDFIHDYTEKAREKRAETIRRPLRKTIVLENDLRYTLREYIFGQESRYVLTLMRESRGPQNSSAGPKPTIKPDWLAETDEEFFDAAIVIRNNGVSMVGTRMVKEEEKTEEVTDDEISIDLVVRNNPHVAKDIEYIARDVIFRGYDLPR